MRNKLMILSALLAGLGVAQAAPVTLPTLSADESKQVHDTFGCVVVNGDCVAEHSLGGSHNAHVNAANILYNKHVRFIPILCGSACVDALDRILALARRDAAVQIAGSGRIDVKDAVCYKKETRLYVHQPYRLKDPSKNNGLPLLDKNLDILSSDDNVDFNVSWKFENADLQKVVNGLGTLPRTLNWKHAKLIPPAEVAKILPACEDRPEFQATQ